MNNFLSNQELYAKTTNYLAVKSAKKGITWNTDDMKPMDAELFVNKKIEYGGTQQLLTGATVKERGVTNFDGNRLVKERVFVGNAICFGWRNEQKDTLVHNVEYNYDSLPNALKHAEIVLKQKNEDIIRLPLNAIHNSTGRSNETYYRELANFAFIEDEAIVDLSIEFPQGVDGELDTDEALFVSVYIRGIQTFVNN